MHECVIFFRNVERLGKPGEKQKNSNFKFIKRGPNAGGGGNDLLAMEPQNACKGSSYYKPISYAQ